MQPIDVLLALVFDYRPEFGLLFCNTCHHPVVPTQIRRHLRSQAEQLSHHRQITGPAVVAKLQDAAVRLPGIVIEPSQLFYPAVPPPMVPNMPLLRGFHCNLTPDCPYMSHHESSLRDHRTEVHSHLATGPGNSFGGSTWDRDVACQRFFPTRATTWTRLYQVQEPTIAPTGSAAARLTTEELDLADQAQHQDLYRAINALEEEAEQQQRLVDASISADCRNAWVSRAEFREHFDGFNCEWAASQLAVPKLPHADPQDPIYLGCAAITKTIHTAHLFAKSKRAGYDARLELAQVGAARTKNSKPLNVTIEDDTVGEYANYWKQAFCYISRTHDLEPVVDSNLFDLSPNSTLDPPAPATTTTTTPSPLEPAPPMTGLVNRRPRYRLLEHQVSELEIFHLSLTNLRDFLLDNPDPPKTHPELLALNQALEQACVDWMISLLDDIPPITQTENALVSASLAMGIGKAPGTWVLAQHYTGILSGLIATSKFMVLYKSWIEIRPEGWATRPENHFNKRLADVVADYAKRLLRPRFDGGTSTPIDWFISLRNFGEGFVQREPQPGKIVWTGGDTMLFNQSELSMPRFGSILQGLYNSTLDCLEELCLVDRIKGIFLPKLDLGKLRDNQAETKAHWSFLRHSSNKTLFQDQRHHLLTRIAADPDLRERFHLNNDVSRFKKSEVGDYLDRVEVFRRQLCILIQLSWGQPARSTELLTIMHRNDIDGSMRGVFIDNGQVGLVTTYHKAQSINGGHGMVIWRFLPKEVGRLLVYYLWLVLPFDHLIRVHGLGYNQRQSPYLFPRRPTPPSGASPRVQRALAPVGSKPPPRAKAKRNQGRTLSRIDPIEWHGDKVREVMNLCFSRHGNLSVNPNIYRHIAIAIYRQFCSQDQHPRLFQLIEQMGPNEHDRRVFAGEAVVNEASDLQAAHSTRVAEERYALLMDHHLRTSQREKENFRTISALWHHQVGFSSILPAKSLSSGYAPSLEDLGIQAQELRLNRLRQADLGAELCRLMDSPTASFRGRQEDALEQIIAGSANVIVVMGTGQGKSLLFMLPALMDPDGLTVVIVPLIALRRDIKDRCDRAGIAAWEWDPYKINPDATICLVTPESATSNHFANYLNAQQSLGRLDRIVFDECHTLLDSTAGWRPKLLRLPHLLCRRHQVPIICLTATLPPLERWAFDQRMWVPGPGPARPVVQIRQSTVRPNIRYDLQELAPGDEALVGLIQGKVDQYAGNGVVLVYASTLKDGRHLAGKLTQSGLPCHFYDHEVGRAGDPQAILQSVISGSAAVVVATTALGLGIDAPSIRAVIHFGQLNTLPAYAQESGRAGRDGLPSEAIIVHTSKTRLPRHILMAKFLEPGVCRRKMLDLVMDGDDKRQSCQAEAGEVLCDFCSGSQRPAPAQALNDLRDDWLKLFYGDRATLHERPGPLQPALALASDPSSAGGASATGGVDPGRRLAAAPPAPASASASATPAAAGSVARDHVASTRATSGVAAGDPHPGTITPVASQESPHPSTQQQQPSTSSRFATSASSSSDHLLTSSPSADSVSLPRKRTLEETDPVIHSTPAPASRTRHSTTSSSSPASLFSTPTTRTHSDLSSYPSPLSTSPAQPHSQPQPGAQSQSWEAEQHRPQPPAQPSPRPGSSSQPKPRSSSSSSLLSSLSQPQGSTPPTGHSPLLFPQESIETLDWLNQWSDRCFVCALDGAQRDCRAHSTQTCAKPVARAVRRALQIIGSPSFPSEYDKYSACFSCNLPQRLCAWQEVTKCTTNTPRSLVWTAFLSLYYSAHLGRPGNQVQDQFANPLRLLFRSCTFPREPFGNPNLIEADLGQLQAVAAQVNPLLVMHPELKAIARYKCTVLWQLVNDAWRTVPAAWL